MTAYTDADVQAAVNAYFALPADYIWPDVSSPAFQGMRDALDAVAPAIAARAKAEALRETADKWAHGQWADAPRRTDRIEERIANARHVADWLRTHAEQIEQATP